MAKSTEERVNDIEEQMGVFKGDIRVLKQEHKDCRCMQDERLNNTKESFDEVRETFVEVKQGQRKLVGWHIANMSIYIAGLIAIIAVLLKIKG